MRVFSRGLLAVLMAVSLLPGTPASAAIVEHVEWTGYGWSDCTTGTSSAWTCYYDIYSSSCPEASALDVGVANCSVEVHGQARIVPILNATGKLVGCTSVALSPATGGYADFTSAFPGRSNHFIANPFTIDAYDVVGDGTPSAVQFSARSLIGEQGTRGWVVTGQGSASCGRGSFSSGTFSGTVDVAIG